MEVFFACANRDFGYGFINAGDTWMSRWKFGSMVSKWVITYSKRAVIFRFKSMQLLTIDPNFQRDIQVCPRGVVGVESMSTY